MSAITSQRHLQYNSNLTATQSPPCQLPQVSVTFSTIPTLLQHKVLHLSFHKSASPPLKFQPNCNTKSSMSAITSQRHLQYNSNLTATQSPPSQLPQDSVTSSKIPT
ncbi:hypothetical protein PoB_000431800 [Plakobranchus ocellatus]|uniref:Uncharacterized protein n=1 Tax=Plakobranchus ocellatus TaxID=259542 RepID=A0AAV3Y6K1_9GAST|nr:hypothetical protein PoB_000431800 [Plakobranchus ocellatus]